MTQFRANVFANFAGQLSVSLIQFLMIPQYVRYLGTDAYGLVGFFLTLQAIFQLLDLGLSPTVNRELARYSVRPETAGMARHFVRTIEVAYCGGGLVLGALLFALAPFIQRYWLTSTSLSPEVVVDALRMMGVLTAAQWPLTLYQGGLLGLGRHGVMNAIRVSMTLVTAGGALLVLTQVSPTVGAFFRWQAAASLAYVAAMAIALWRCLPPSDLPSRPQLRLLGSVWKFAAGMTGIAVTGLVLTQIDKVVLSRVSPLAEFGVYTVAAALGNALYSIIGPMFASVFPRLSALVGAGDFESARSLYRRAWLMATVMLVPAAAVIAIFSRELLQVWTRNAGLAETAAPIVSLLVTGTALNGLMNVPYALQLAHGWTSTPLRLNIVLALVAVPAAILLTRSHGALGAAMIWPGANAVYAAVMIPLTYRHFAETRGRWIWREVPLAVATAVALPLVVHAMMPSGISAFTAIGFAAAAWALAVAATVLVTPEVRREVAHYTSAA